MKRIARVAGIVLAILLVVGFVAQRFISVDQFRPLIEEQLTSTLGRPVKIGSLHLSLLSGGVSASGLSIAEDPEFGSGTLVSAESMKMGVNWRVLITSRKLEVTRLIIESPGVLLRQSPAGLWNFSKLAAHSPHDSQPSTPPVDFSIKLLKIENGSVSLKTSSWSNPLQLKQADIEAQNFTSTSSFPFSLSATLAGGGDIKVDGKAGPIGRDDATMTPLDAALKLTRLDLTGSGVVTPTAGLAGLISLDVKAASDGRNVQLQGRAKAEQLKLAQNGSPARQAVLFDFSLGHDLVSRTGALRRGDVQIGSARASLTGTYTMRGDSIPVSLNFQGLNMPVQDLVGMLPALGITLPSGATLQGGTIGAKLALEGPTDRPAGSGVFELKNTRLAGFDLASKMSPIVKLAGLPGSLQTDIQIMSASLRIAPEGLGLTNIQLVAPVVGTLSGAGTVSPSHTLNFTMRANIQNASLGPLNTLGAIPFFIRGTASEPIFQPDMSGLARENVKRVEGDAVKKAGDLFHGLVDRLKPK